MAIYVLDTTILSNFVHAGRPDLIRMSLGTLAATTPAVMAELSFGERTGEVAPCDWTWLTILELSDSELAAAARLRTGLDSGEAECLAVAQRRGGILVSDDREARRLARELEVACIGTIGTLKSLVDDGVLTLAEADDQLHTMVTRGFYSPVASLGQLRGRDAG